MATLNLSNIYTLREADPEILATNNTLELLLNYSPPDLRQVERYDHENESDEEINIDDEEMEEKDSLHSSYIDIKRRTNTRKGSIQLSWTDSIAGFRVDKNRWYPKENETGVSVAYVRGDTKEAVEKWRNVLGARVSMN